MRYAVLCERTADAWELVGLFDGETAEDAVKAAGLVEEASDSFVALAMDDAERVQVAYRRRVVGITGGAP